MSDITTRLRSVNNTQRPYANDQVLGWCHEAADTLDAERAKVKRLREALEPFAAFREAQQHLGGNHPATGTLYAVASRGGEAEITVEDLEKARAALRDTADA